MAYISFQPKDHFNILLNTGDGTTNKSFTGVGFQPDMIWNKIRSTTYAHWLYDAVRGAGAEKEISPNGTAGMGDNDNAQYGYISSFDSDGFSVTGSSSSAYFNQNSETYVNWFWKANGQGSSNTDGSINTTYTSANTTSGFSISTYSGTGSAATIGHGLGAIPQVMIVKNTYQAEHWIVYHHKSNATPEDYYLRLNDTSAAADFGMWNDTAPTSSVFSVGTSTSVNQAGGTFVAYCFAEKKGFSKFGSYTGNGNADGAFIYTGFKPAFVIIKSKGSGTDWRLVDNKRDTFNPSTKQLFPNTNGAETTHSNYGIDFLYNGFKHRNTNSDLNQNSVNYIYMAFAEAPLVSSNGVPAVAR
jgi:hypothetical protein